MSCRAGPADRLAAVLRRARDLGLLGPGPIEDHIAHARAFAAGVPTPDRALDLGSGGGVPGLVLAAAVWFDTKWTLVDAAQRRAAFLDEAVTTLAIADRVSVVRARAEVAGRDPALRSGFAITTARAFGPPAVTAECAAPFLRVGGRLVVSEPPGGDPTRWDAAGLAELGLVPLAHTRPPVPAFADFEAVALCPARYPRRVGIPAKRPLF